MALPPTAPLPRVDEIDIQSLLNVPVPSVSGIAPPVSPVRQVVSPYSRTNLPEFMRQRVEVAPGLFGPSQGLLGAAPITAPQQYISEYAPLEQAFQESFAARPEYFGAQYQPSPMTPIMPSIPAIGDDRPMSLEQGLTTAAAMKALYDVKDPLIDYGKSIFESEPVQAITDAALFPAKKAVDVAQSLVPEGVGTQFQEAKDQLLDSIDLSFGFETGDTIKNLKNQFAGVSDAIGFVGDIENAITSPSYNTMQEGIKAVEALYDYVDVPDIITGEQAQIISPELQSNLLNFASGVNVLDFAKDPSSSKAASAYVSADQLASNVGIELPYTEQISPIADIVGAGTALKGGIDTPGEAAQVVKGLSGAAELGLIGDIALTSPVGVAGPVQPFMLSNLSGPLTAATALLAAPALIEGGAAGDIPRVESTLGFDNGNLIVLDTASYDFGKSDFVAGQTENAQDFVNWMQNTLNYEVDQKALEDWSKTDQDTIVDKYAYFTSSHGMSDPSVNAADFVVNMLEAGVLKPTADTPAVDLQSAINLLQPEVTGYSDFTDQLVSSAVNVPYVVGEVYPTPEYLEQKKAYEEALRKKEAEKGKPKPPAPTQYIAGTTLPLPAVLSPDFFSSGMIDDPATKGSEAVAAPSSYLNLMELLKTLPV